MEGVKSGWLLSNYSRRDDSGGSSWLSELFLHYGCRIPGICWASRTELAMQLHASVSLSCSCIAF
eukprot:scaffold34064_cov121-Cyclotella_meneghiniana.AAC.11